MTLRIDHRILRWAFVGVALSLIWGQAIRTGLSGDVYWQWEAGIYMLAHHAVLHDNVFSYTLYHKPWVTEEWGYEVLLAAAINVMGPVGFWAMGAGIGSVTIVLFTWLLDIRGIAGVKNGLLVLMAAPGLLPFIKDRPQTVSYALFVLMLIVLSVSRTRPKVLWWAVPMLWFWTNVHGSFLLGFLLLLLEGLWSLWPIRTARVSTGRTRVRLRQWAAVAATSVLLSFINPNGPGLWAYSWHVSFSRRISEVIAEWQSPNFHLTFLVAVILVPMFILVLLIMFGSERVPWPDFFLTAGLFYATMKSLRFLAYYDLEWPVMLGVMARRAEFRRTSGWVGAPVLLALSVLLLMTGSPVLAPSSPSSEPVAQANYLLRHTGRVFNMYHWGGYLIYRHVPVFIDGRTDFFLQGNEIQEYVAVKNLSDNPSKLWKRYNIRYVLWEPHTALSTYLLSRPGQWTPVVRTKTAILFERR